MPNGAAAKAGLNRSLLDVAIGDLRAKVEQKCNAWDREFTRPKAQNSSITCNACGCVDKANRLKQAEFKCVACGHTDHADDNAAKNHLTRGLSDFVRSYRTWDWQASRETLREVKRVEPLIDRAVKPEASSDAPMGEDPIQSPKKGKRSAQTALGTPLQLDLWGDCDAIA